MRIWYERLSSKYRYDEIMICKIRNDWIDYMSSLKDEKVFAYLASELQDKKRRGDQITATRKVLAIESGFAELIGGDASSVLKKARDLNFKDVNREGYLAPEGKEFDFRGELQSKK